MPAPDFGKWYSAPHRSSWKLWWGDEEISGSAVAVKAQTKSEYGHKEPHSWAAAGNNRMRRNDWLLTFTLTERGLKSLSWFYVDFVVKLSRDEKRFYNRD